MPERLLIGAGERLRSLRRAGSERGSFLIEIVISAALIGVVTMGVFAAIDRANASSGRNKSVSVASALAEQDQERLRAIPGNVLGNRDETNTKVVDGIGYTVRSQAQWVSDVVGAQSCLSGSARSDYVKTTSTVTWPDMRLAKPVVADSIVEPPIGTIDPNATNVAAMITKRDGTTGLVGLPVNLIGPPTFAATTDQNGCAYFGNITAAPYTINASLQGFTTPDWKASINDGPFTPPAGSVAIKQYLYDRAASVNVTVDTKLANGTVQPDTTDIVTFAHTSIPGTQQVQLGTSGVQASSFGSNLAFPFTSPYSVYAGKCVGANPALYGGASPPQQFQFDPGQTYNASSTPPLVVRKPALNVKVLDGATPANPIAGATVRVTPSTITDPNMSGCSSYTFTTNASGLVPVPSVPYGHWIVCANTAGATPKRAFVPSVVTNSDPNGTALQTVSITGSSVSGTCP